MHEGMMSVVLLLVLMFCSVHSFSEMLPRAALLRLVLLDRDAWRRQSRRWIAWCGVSLSIRADTKGSRGHCLFEAKRMPSGSCHQSELCWQGTNNPITRQELDFIHSRLKDMLRDEDKDAILDDIYVCTSVNESNNNPRMKPNPGMIVEAMKDAHVEPHECIMIGDSLRDLQAAHAGGVFHKILVSTGYGSSLMNGLQSRGEHLVISSKANCTVVPESLMPFVYVDNLDQAVRWVLSH